MKFLLKTVLKILFYMIILTVPVTIFITFFSLNRSGIPLWNLGIRNIIRYSQNYYPHSIFFSYLLSTLLAISLVDKMKVKSLLLLHIPPVIVAGIIGGLLYFTRSEKIHLPLIKGELTLGINTVLRKGTFNELGNLHLFIQGPEEQRYTIYLYDKEHNELNILRDMNPGKRGENYFFVDPEKRQITIRSVRGTPEVSILIPFSDIPYRKNAVSNRLLTSYGKRVGSAYGLISDRINSLEFSDTVLFLGSLFLSVLMISIPLTYGLNDKGWGFSGIIGVFLVLGLLPFFYGFVLKIMENLRLNLTFLGKYSFIFPSIVFGFIGIALDIVVKAGGRVKS